MLTFMNSFDAPKNLPGNFFFFNVLFKAWEQIDVSPRVEVTMWYRFSGAG